MQHPLERVFWQIAVAPLPALRGERTVDIVIVGGGMAGLNAAHAAAAKGLRVALCEQYYCGSGATGKSSGFITPDSEISFSQYIKRAGLEHALRIWSAGTAGVELIRSHIQTYNLSCDYQEQSTLVVANTRSRAQELLDEHEVRQRYGLSSAFYDQHELSTRLAADGYYAGQSFGPTFGIRAFDYCQAMKTVVQEHGVAIYEETPVLAIKENTVITPTGRITANNIIVCADWGVRALGLLRNDVYYAQTFLMLSLPLTDQQVARIFPNERYMVWDTDLVYTYYRLTGDNRLMVGGATLLTSYPERERCHNTRIVRKLSRSIESRFPGLKITFEYIWPGLIGVSRDLSPIADFDPRMPSVYYVTGTAGLPWAAALGQYSVEKIVDGRDDLDQYFSLKRRMPLPGWSSYLIGTQATFALSNFLAIW